jgi:peptide/nickel transport system permease protein
MFRNAMLPQLTGLALSLGMMIGGALITEMIFSYPGLGMAVLTAIQGNDYPLIQGCTLLITVSVLVANFSVDVLIGFLDPRVKAGQGGKSHENFSEPLKSPFFFVGISHFSFDNLD